ERFDPTRLSLRSAPTLAKVNAKAGLHFAGDRLRPADAGSAAEVPAGAARVVRDGLGRTGVYRDEAGGVHAVSLRCTDLGWRLCSIRSSGAQPSHSPASWRSTSQPTSAWTNAAMAAASATVAGVSAARSSSVPNIRWGRSSYHQRRGSGTAPEAAPQRSASAI